mmetsp:Transcript_64799/g.210112  ORF Transcript_64799/g.210112 Transcript_64799/m.210112 type:complete len:297 (+) Transcript_64799:69-959(+)
MSRTGSGSGAMRALAVPSLIALGAFGYLPGQTAFASVNQAPPSLAPPHRTGASPWATAVGAAAARPRAGASTPLAGAGAGSLSFLAKLAAGAALVARFALLKEDTYMKPTDEPKPPNRKGAQFDKRKRMNPLTHEHNLGYRIHGGPGYAASPHKWVENIRWCHRFRRRISLRRKINGNKACPRIAFFMSHENLHLNVVDDTEGTGKMLTCLTTTQKGTKTELKDELKSRGKEFMRNNTAEACEFIGKKLGMRLLEMGITEAIFDRGGFRPWFKQVKACREGIRSCGVIVTGAGQWG